jgi:anaerobic ribonucleoside-triphosphate reductase activating protein
MLTPEFLIPALPIGLRVESALFVCEGEVSLSVRIAGLIHDSIVDGPGLRYVVFVQGCLIDCEGCHNPEAQNVDGGTEMPVDEIIADMLGNPLTDGLTLSGGEPFLQAAECVKLSAAARENGLNVWTYSGYMFEELFDRARSEQAVKELLELTDVLIDGPFVLAERTLSLKWRGSRNQRLIDVQKSIVSGEAIAK